VVDEVEHGLKPGQYIRMDIADEGVGIPPDYLAKVFDPFFSTKDAGSGLGLSTSYSIVKKHGGHIKVESRIGRGSKFSIFLPVAKRSVKCTSSEPDRQMFEGGKILVMDDEESVRNVIRPSLQKLGFEVLEARDSSEATGIFRRIVDSGDSLVVALLDLTIPGSTGGVETLRILKSIDPDVKAIVMSGYVLDPVMQNYGNFGFCGSIRKPFGTNELREALSLVLIDANPLKST
jgi:CheY-like chemotaxis protein